MSYDLQLAERIRKLVKHRRDVSEKEMFGGICFLHRERMFIGIVKSELMVRVGKDNHDAAVAVPHVRQMDFTGRPMRGYVFVAADGLKTDEMLTAWVDRGETFVTTLPEKGAAVPTTAKKEPAVKKAKKAAKKKKPAKKKPAKKKLAKKKAAKKKWNSASRKAKTRRRR